MAPKYFFLLLAVAMLAIPVLAADPYDGYIPPSVTCNEPCDVAFTDISYGVPTIYNWTRHDIITAGTIPLSFSTASDPGVVTFYRGNWSIQLYTSNAYGTNWSPANISFVNVTGESDPPVANFTGTPTTGYADLLVSFTDLSTNNPTSWQWEYWPTAKGTSFATVFSTEKNATYAFAYVDNLGPQPGHISIRLTATNAAGSSTFTRDDYIVTTEVPLGAPVANYTPRGTFVTPPVGASYWSLSIENGTTVQFNDTSTGGVPTAWNWSFQKADGTLMYSSSQNPAIAFNISTFGTMERSVTFNVSNSGGYSRTTGAFTVSAPPVPPVAQYYATNVESTQSLLIYSGGTEKLVVANGQTVTFTDASLNSPTSWQWDISAGNGTSYTYYTKNATMKYTDATAGDYPVTFTATNEDGSNSVIRTDVISVGDYTAPASVTGITNSTGLSTIQWNWTQASDVAGVRIWKDGILFENVTTSGTLWTGLASEVTYNISTKTYDAAGNLNGTFVNSTARTTPSIWTFTSDGTFTVPLGVTRIVVKMIGGGASGAGSYTNPGLWSYAGFAGNPGASETFLMNVTPGDTYPIIIGLGGANKSSSSVSAGDAAGNAGLPTSAFGHTVSGGASPANRYPDATASGGNATSNGLWSTARFALNGTGEDGPGGICGLGYGAPGGGAGAYTTVASIGGRGANGTVIIEDTAYSSTINIPDFVADQTSANPSTLIRFTDLSTVTDTGGLTYNWSFGDGGYSSTVGNTQHVYTYAGVYDVSLALSTSNGTVTEKKTEYISIYNQENTLNTYTPWLVRIRVTDAFGVPLPGARIAVSYIATSLPNTNTSFLQKAFGVDQTVATAMASSGLAMSSNTTDDGSTTFLMFPVISYGLTITNATAGLNNYKTLTPRDQDYIIRCPLADQHAPNNTLTQVTTSRNLFYRLNSTYYNLSMIYQDSSGYTTNLKFQVYDYSNGNTMIYNHDLGNPGTAVVTDNFTVYLPLGQEYRWGYNATKV